MPVTIYTDQSIKTLQSFIDKNQSLIADNQEFIELLRKDVKTFYDLVTNNKTDLILRLSELLNAQTEFGQKFKNQNANPFISNITIPYNTLESAVLSCGYDEDKILLNFIHRYDTEANRWYLCMECCEMQGPGGAAINVGGTDFYKREVLNHGARFDLYNGLVSTSTLTTDFDQDYFDNIKVDGADLVQGDDVNSIMLPWQSELKRMYIHNGLSGMSNIFVKFESGTSDHTGMINDDPDLGSSKVQWPHGLMIYMNNNGQDCLNNGQEAHIFQNKACNFGSMCPPRCNNYYWPEHLSIS